MKALTSLIVLFLISFSAYNAWSLTPFEQKVLYYYYTTPEQRMEGKIEELIKQNERMQEDMLQQERQIEELEREQEELRYEHYRRRD